MAIGKLLAERWGLVIERVEVLKAGPLDSAGVVTGARAESGLTTNDGNHTGLADARRWFGI